MLPHEAEKEKQVVDFRKFLLIQHIAYISVFFMYSLCLCLVYDVNLTIHLGAVYVKHYRQSP